MGISNKLDIVRQKELVNNDKVQATKNFVEHIGAMMGFQIPLLVLIGEESRSCLE